jgi:hypothetical protein
MSTSSRVICSLDLPLIMANLFVYCHIKVNSCLAGVLGVSRSRDLDRQASSDLNRRRLPSVRMTV